MKTFILITALLLCSFDWISMSVSQNVEVQPGEEVTLQCANISTGNTATFWFRLPNASCISAMSSSDSNVSFCDGFKKSKFHMTSNTSMLFLEIKQVNSSDSALYFCGEKQSDGKTIISSGTYLKVQGNRIYVADGLTYEQMMTVILGNLTVFLLLVIVSLAVKIRRFHTGIYTTSFKLSNQTFANVDSDAMTYTSVSFHPKAKIRRPEPPRELEPNVVYAATR
uniref:Ig-like domain-containing protein n=1 Tax=Neolamprologus brichardi TaxID=32507 RepID=A0A3Q4MQ06_NEOBR